MAAALIDTHLHLWDPAQVPWTRGAPVFNHVFGAAEFAADMPPATKPAANTIVAAPFAGVENRYAIGEA